MGSVTGDEVTSDLSSPGERIFVSVRVRPLNDKEVTRNEIVDWECINDNSVIYKNNDGPDRSMYPTSYTFDRVFGCHSSTRQVYEEGAKAVALSVVGGINSSIFAYGQTSSGKTYTMGGITEYTLADIFEYIRKHNERNFILKFSALEIYNESVRDFLSSDPTPLRLLDDPERGTVVEKLTEEVVRDWNHLKLLLSICEAQRQVGETNLNESSSRSHQIIRLTIESTTKEMSGSLKSSILSATVNFVDLAGSERASQALSAGSRLKEGSHINRSLLTLGTVIRKLSKGRNGHIPYRDSKLTRILQSSLGGNARTAIICTMSPARSYVEQSRNTLLFATCAKEVTTHARVNLVISDKALVKQLQRELARLENELRNVGKYGSYETSILLRDKDLQIEKLERQVRELTMERDRALSRIHDLQQEDEAENNPTVWEASPLYSKFKIHAHSSWETQTSSSSTVADPQFSDAGSRTREFPQFTLRHCRTNSEANSLHSDIRLDLLPGIVTEPLSSDTSSYASPTPLRETHNLVISGNQDHVSTESGDKVDGGAGEDFCRDVQCIESQESAATSYDGISSSFYVKEPGEDLPPLLIPRSKEPIVEEPTSSSLTQDRELDSDRYYKGVALQISETSSSWQEVPDANNDESLADTGTSEAAAVVNGVLPSVQTNKDEDDDDIKHEQNTQAGSGIDFTVKLQDIQRKLSELKGDGDSGKFSRKSSITSSHREAQATDANDVAERSTPSAEVKELHEIYKEEVTDTLEEEEEDVVQLKVENPPKSVKDVGLDPQDDLDMADGAQCPHTNFKTIQQEVISLWDVCNVSLTYRTYFFLLYKNDPADSIYMEVELRRLRFIRDALSRGNETPLHGQTITPLSLSEKSLRRERQMLGKLLKKRISREDRESLFLRWGIRSESKRRCSQLVQRIWSSTEEMDHIAASSELVAKLVKFSDKQVRKELFGLNLMSIPKDTGRSSRSYSCRWSPMPHR